MEARLWGAFPSLCGLPQHHKPVGTAGLMPAPHPFPALPTQLSRASCPAPAAPRWLFCPQCLRAGGVTRMAWPQGGVGAASVQLRSPLIHRCGQAQLLQRGLCHLA